MKQTQVRLKTYITYIFFNIYIYILQNATEDQNTNKKEEYINIYQCDCGKRYLSQPALNNHKKTKHPETLEGVEKRGKGRPPKYLPNTPGEIRFLIKKIDRKEVMRLILIMLLKMCLILFIRRKI